MNALEYLEADHDKLAELFELFDRAEDNAHGDLFAKLKSVLAAHIYIEEKIFFPGAIASNIDEIITSVGRRKIEHSEISKHLDEISTLEPNNKNFSARLRSLIELVETHINEEEGELFPIIENGLDQAALNEITAKIENELTKRDKLS